VATTSSQMKKTALRGSTSVLRPSTDQKCIQFKSQHATNVDQMPQISSQHH